MTEALTPTIHTLQPPLPLANLPNSKTLPPASGEGVTLGVTLETHRQGENVQKTTTKKSWFCEDPDTKQEGKGSGYFEELKCISWFKVNAPKGERRNGREI